MARKPLFSVHQSEGGMKSVFDAFYRKGGLTKEKADVQVLFRKGSGLPYGAVPLKKIREWLISKGYLEHSVRTPNALCINGYWDPKVAAKEFYDYVMGVKPVSEPEVKIVETKTIVKQTVEPQEVFSDATGFAMRWMKTAVYWIGDHDLNCGTVTGFRTGEDLESIELQIDCSIWVPKELCYNSLDDFTKMLENKLKKF